MREFMDQEFLLTTKTASLLYNEYVKKMPIIDYHCHISPMEIAQDRKFENITQLWLGGDHYKWRQMRSNGVDEAYITGDGDDRTKFHMWVQTLTKAIGNPLYHWSHLELQRYFDYHGVLNEDTEETVWNLCNEKLKDPKMSAQNLMRMSNVKLVCTTDDPADDLRWHKMLSMNPEFEIQVLPAFRPDKAMVISQPGFREYIRRLSKASGIEVSSFATWKEVMIQRLELFISLGCKVTDHGLLFVPFRPISEGAADQLLQKALSGQGVTEEESLQFMTAAMLFLGEEYAKRNLVMQLHFGATRNNNHRMFDQIGPDTGFDAIYNRVPIQELGAYLNALEEHKSLPKTILYSLNPNDNAALDALIGCFQNSDAVGKIQHGAAWWFNDHRSGMSEQLTSLANLGLLGNFIGMLTDSRSFLSYTRHEYFRRILCQMIGNLVEQGEYPMDLNSLRSIVEGISYTNARDYFGFSI